MKKLLVKFIFRNALHEYMPESKEFEEYNLNIDDNTTIKQIFDSVSLPLADLSEYYNLSGVFTFNSCYLPYIINSNNKVEWDISYENSKVIDFLNTHEIEVVKATYGYPQAGGPGFKDITEIWNLIYPIVDTFVTVYGFGEIISGAGKWLYSLFNKKNECLCPQAHFDFLFSKEKWNHHELATYLDISADKAKELLRLFGYQYDKSKCLYVQQPQSLELKERLSKINVLDTD